MFIFLILPVIVPAQKIIFTSIEKTKNAYSHKIIRRPVSLEIFGTNGLLLEERRYNTSDTGSFDKTLYTYNQQNHITSRTEFYGPRPESFIRKDYFYHVNGTLSNIQYKQRDKKGDSVLVTEMFSFGKKGELLKKTINYGYPGGVEFYEYKYAFKNGDSVVTEQSYWKGERKKMKNRKTTILNKQGLAISIYRKNEGYRYFEYNYNSSGEWITKKACFKYLKLHSWTCETYTREVIRQETDNNSF
jgi:hypothetical protein